MLLLALARLDKLNRVAEITHERRQHQRMKAPRIELIRELVPKHQVSPVRQCPASSGHAPGSIPPVHLVKQYRRGDAVER